MIKFKSLMIFVLCLSGIITMGTVILYASAKQSGNGGQETIAIHRGRADVGILPKLVGTWINVQYIDVLRKTKSPKRAIIERTSFRIERKADNYGWMQIYSFNEGVYRKLEGLKPSGDRNSYIVLHDAMKFWLDTWTISEDGQSLVWSYRPQGGSPTNEKEYDKASFIRIGMTEVEFVNRVVLVGEYRDGKDQLYEFSTNGIAKWPGDVFRYEVEVNGPALSECDFLKKYDDEGKLLDRMGFRWQGNDLLLYKARLHNGAIICDSDSFLTLRKTE